MHKKNGLLKQPIYSLEHPDSSASFARTPRPAWPTRHPCLPQYPDRWLVALRSPSLLIVSILANGGLGILPILASVLKDHSVFLATPTPRCSG